MQEYADRLRDAHDRAAGGGGGHGGGAHGGGGRNPSKWSFQPKPPREIPDFKRLQDEFRAQIQARRAAFKPTVPVDFRSNGDGGEMTEAEREKRRRELEAELARMPELRWPYMVRGDII